MDARAWVGDRGVADRPVRRGDRVARARRWPEARHVAESLRERDDFPHDVADALAYISAHDVAGYAEAVESVVASFETRDEHLEDVAVADTALALQELARRRGMEHTLPASPVLPGSE